MSAVPSLRALSGAQFKMAQWCLGGALAADCLAAVAGVVGCTRPAWSGWMALALASFAALSALLRRLSTKHADSAHDILRRLDLQDGLGRAIDPMAEADLRADVPWFVETMARKVNPHPYFASDQQPGATRLLENLRESSWWTATLAGEMAKVSRAFGGILGILALLTLIATVTGVFDGEAITRFSNWISAAILLGIAQGPQHARDRYMQLRDGARAVVDESKRLLGLPATNESDALVLAGDYYLVRQGAPVIPTPYYNFRRRKLNVLWDATLTKLSGEAGLPAVRHSDSNLPAMRSGEAAIEPPRRKRWFAGWRDWAALATTAGFVLLLDFTSRRRFDVLPEGFDRFLFLVAIVVFVMILFAVSRVLVFPGVVAFIRGSYRIVGRWISRNRD